MPMDLNSLDTVKASETGAVLEVLHPVTQVPIGAKITLAGIDSDIYKNHVNRAANKRSQKMRPGQPWAPLTAEEQEENGLSLLATCTIAWEGVVVDGAELPCTLENAKELYRRFPWVREQVDFFIANRANFLSG